MHKQALLFVAFLVVLPLMVAWYQLSFLMTVFLVAMALFWRWVISLSSITSPDKGPEIILKTILASHFSEKVRWCLDRLGTPYTEKPAAGTLGVFFAGRTVPVLYFKTGLVRSSVGNSAEILRYLWGRYSVELGNAADFLAPTPDRLQWEKRIDRYGVDLQSWVYYHILDDRSLTLRAWGSESPAVPLVQRLLLKILFPLQRFLIRKAFNISDEHHAIVLRHIDKLLSETEVLLADNRQFLLGGEQISYVDLTFCSISGLWLMPQNYGAGKSQSVRVENYEAPEQMQQEIKRFKTDYPTTTAFIERMYKDERLVFGAGESQAARA